MAVLTCKRMAEGQSASEDSATEQFLVRVDNKHDHPLEFIGVIQSNGWLPRRGDGHPRNPFFRCTGLKTSRLNGDSLLQWVVHCDYRLALGDRDRDAIERDLHPNPLDRRPKVVKNYTRTEVIAHKDKNNKAILNGAGDPYLDPVVVPASYPSWVVTCYVPVSPAWMDDLSGKVNADTFVIRGRSYPPRTLLFEPGEESDLKEENGVQYYEVTFRLMVKTEEWKERRYHNGLNEVYNVPGGFVDKRTIKLPLKNPETGATLKYEDESRNYTPVPQMLTSTGYLIENPTPDNVAPHDIDVFEETAFNGQLPNLGM